MDIRWKGASSRCIWLLLASGLAIAIPPADHVLGGTQTKSNAVRAGDAQAGRAVFNGKGVCYYCHGINGDRHQLPQLEPDTAAMIARLNPQPADLRNPRELRLKTDKERAKIIREGHEGTAMFPDTRMNEQELADTLAYLAVLRQEGHAK